MKKMILIAAAFAAFTGCTKDTVAPAEDNQQTITTSAQNTDPKQETTSAVIEWAGNPEADGFGWVIHTTSGEIVVPDNLSEEFTQDQMPVTVSFARTDKRVPCRCTQPKYYVHILSIQRANKG